MCVKTTNQYQLLIVSLAITEDGKPGELHRQARLPPQALPRTAGVDEAAEIAPLLGGMDAILIGVLTLGCQKGCGWWAEAKRFGDSWFNDSNTCENDERIMICT